jgi:hypothetical protein
MEPKALIPSYFYLKSFFVHKFLYLVVQF